MLAAGALSTTVDNTATQQAFRTGGYGVARFTDDDEGHEVVGGFDVVDSLHWVVLAYDNASTVLAPRWGVRMMQAGGIAPTPFEGHACNARAILPIGPAREYIVRIWHRASHLPGEKPMLKYRTIPAFAVGALLLCLSSLVAPTASAAGSTDRLPVFTVGVDTRNGNPFSIAVRRPISYRQPRKPAPRSMHQNKKPQ